MNKIKKNELTLAKFITKLKRKLLITYVFIIFTRIILSRKTLHMVGSPVINERAYVTKGSSHVISLTVSMTVSDKF